MAAAERISNSEGRSQSFDSIVPFGFEVRWEADPK
jgi:hypothetical protein